MRILVSNDDGIQARGIIALAEALVPLGEVIVVAPNAERSAASHALTLEHPLRAKPAVFPVAGVTKAYAVNGTPADCVKLALSSLLDEPPDLVATGINRGANLAVDVFYSGTVAGAFEGLFRKLPSIAFSLASYEETADLSGARHFIRPIVEKLMQMKSRSSVLYNVNFPALPPDQIRGIRGTRLGQVSYSENYDRRSDPAGRPYFWLKGELSIVDPSPDTDVVAVRDGYVSISPFRAELTDFEALESLQRLAE
ncbi:MAG TPA: 5'/3'-nucleotidase SurE [Candidatus Ozemobacteraceae bacterium]|nr:5'/3'-nucleotidase SurE [Candidatus Ozemobacteraceae bacterium]